VNCVSQEEFEDSAGNVVTKKTYEDLRRQGLLWSSRCFCLTQSAKA